MFKRTTVCLLLVFICECAWGQWTQWRGSVDGQGIIQGKAPVTEWSETKNIIWKTPIPGRGSSSPVVSNGKIFLTSADDKRGKLYLLCFDQASGKLLWEKLAFWGTLLDNLHKLNTHASPSPATDGKIVTVLFGLKEAVWLAAFNFEGKKLWDVEVAKVKSNFGIGSSPVVYEDKVIVLNDMEPEPLIAAYRLTDGSLLWKTYRNGPGDADFHSYSTPRIFKVQGKDQVVATGLGQVKFYDPANGKLLWRIEASSDVTVGTPLINRHYLYANGGWPQRGSASIDVRRREVVWRNRFDSYISSMVFHKDYIYGSTNRGELACQDAKSGVVVWRERFREDVQSSPFIAGGHLYLLLRNGTTKVIKPDSVEYIEVSENRIPGITDATPAVVDGRIYYRGEDALYCIGRE